MNNLILNYLQNNQSPIQHQRDTKNTKSTFSMPSVNSTMDSFDRETDKLIKPLNGRGYLVSKSPLNAPKEYVRDTIYTTKALADGMRGKANDHQLGKLNDLGLKVGGLAIATYLMTRKTTPKTKLMEFVGFGAFLLSMKLWPKLALEIPARLIHGFDYRKEYIDDQGRKKEVGLDPNYMPFDLYRGEKKSEDLDVIGDRMGIRRDMVNRKEAVKDQMRKISVQNNTLWMLTAGLATPIMTALACNKAEEYITPIAENISNKKVNKSIDNVSNYLNGHITNTDEITKYEENILKISGNKETETEKLIKSLQGKVVTNEHINQLSETLASGFNADMKDAANQDIRDIIGGKKYFTNSEATSGLATELHSIIKAGNPELATKISPVKLEKTINEGAIRGAVRNMLTSVGTDMLDVFKKDPNNAHIADLINDVSTNFKCKDLASSKFFEVTPETEAMTPVERLAHNIKSIVMKVNNSAPHEDFIPKMSALEQANRGIKTQIDAKLQAQADEIAKSFYNGTLPISDGKQSYITDAISGLYKKEAPNSAKNKNIFHSIRNAITNHFTNKQGFFITEDASKSIIEASKSIRKYNAIDKLLTEGAHFKVEKANETLVANNWEKVSNTLLKELGITDADLKLASKDKNLAHELFAKKLETACADPEKYKKLITSLASKMIELDEKMDTPNSDSTGSMMKKIEAGIEKNCHNTGSTLEGLKFTEMQKNLVSSVHSQTGINIGSILNAKKERLHSRIDGVHGSYMRLIQTCEFFHRSNEYEKAIGELNAEGANYTAIAEKMGLTLPESNKKEFLSGKIAEKFGMDADEKVSKEIIKKGKNLLLKSHTNEYYNKLGSLNNPNFFEKLMTAIFRPSTNKTEWDKGWNETTSRTFDLLNTEVKNSNGETPLRVFEGQKGFGQKLKEHMNQSFNTLGAIVRRVYEGHEPLTAGSGVSPKDSRASAIFDLVGKSPSEFFFDTAKQKYNTGKWLKTFKPILGATVGITLLAQFFFGKKDPDIKA